jgi:hypothetical protein
MMKLPVTVLAVLFIATAVASARSEPGEEARPRDLQRLQEDLANLDDELQTLETSGRSADEFRRRAEDIREETVYLKVKMRHHQREEGGGTGVSYAEVAELRRSITDLREDLGRSLGGGPREVRLEEGTLIQVRLEQAVSSRTARREDRVDASVARPVRVAGALALSAGTQVRGIVREVERAERPSRGGRLELEFDAAYVDETRVELRGRVVEISEGGGRAEKAGIGAVLGGVIGGMFGGKTGAIAGVVLGGGGAVVASKGDDVELPAGTVLSVRLERPLVVPRAARRD